MLGLAARIGVKVADNVTPYVKLGAEFSGITYTAVHYTRQRITRKNSMTGFAVGVGTDITFVKNFLLRIEWTFATYATVTPQSLAFNDPFVPGGAQRTNIQVKPCTQAFRIGVGYTF